MPPIAFTGGPEESGDSVPPTPCAALGGEAAEDFELTSTPLTGDPAGFAACAR